MTRESCGANFYARLDDLGSRMKAKQKAQRKRQKPPVYVRAKAREKRCHELAGKGILQDGAERWTLVHGATVAGIDHAWLELDGRFYDPVADSFDAQFAPGRIDHRYTQIEAGKLISKTNNWGPWTDAERAAALRH